MSDINKILYTLAKYDPRKVAVDDEKIVDVQEHYDLVDRLSESSVDKYNNVLLGMVRYLDANTKNHSKMVSDIANAFIGVEFEHVKDTDNLYLVERVLVGDEIYFEPLNVWSADVRVFKAVLMRNLAHAGMKEDDLQVIIFKHRLNKYYSSVKIGGVDDSEKISFVNRYNHYLFEFYIRSNDPDPWVLNDYFDNSTVQAMPFIYRIHNNNSKIMFSHELSLRGTFEQAEANINEYCENIKHYTRRMYELTYGEDYCMASSGQGKSHYKEKFKTYDKCLQVYDRYKDMIPVDESIEDDRFGVKIDKEEGTRGLSDQKRLDRRKEIRKNYKMAQELIKQSTQGYLS